MPLRAAFLALLLLAPAAAQQAAETETPLLKAMRSELQRSFEKLKTAGEAPLYFLGYRVYDIEEVDVTASYGAIDAQQAGGHSRHLDIELRVGTPRLDSTHALQQEPFDLEDIDLAGRLLSGLPIEDDPAAIRAALWLATDRRLKQAQKRFAKVKATKAVKTEEEDPSDDFSADKPQVSLQAPLPFKIDRAPWEARMRRSSSVFRDYAFIYASTVSFSAVRTRRCIVTSEGAAIQDDRIQYRLFMTAETKAEDGMNLPLYEGWEVTTPDALPDDAALETAARGLAASLKTLREAPLAEPYAGPAILRSRAAGVFFHEIFGHRIEGHRQKNEDEGRTFAKKVGTSIMPDFITVTDDPLREKIGKTPLNGTYLYDDEGVAAQKVVLVDKGVLKGFLMGRSPVKGFPVSNGHGRCSPGSEPVARQGNLCVESSTSVPYARLREMLIGEVKKQGKPYGLIFDDIAGGFTFTQSFMPQSFKLLPLRVWRVYPDGRPDEVLRGVDIVGTPLASLERILCAADDTDVFNGTCGAESGWVPVSASSPSLLVATIEVEKQRKSRNRLPLLPAPRHDPEEKKEKKP